MIKRRFYKMEHGDRDDAANQSSSSSSDSDVQVEADSSEDDDEQPCFDPSGCVAAAFAFAFASHSTSITQFAYNVCLFVCLFSGYKSEEEEDSSPNETLVDVCLQEPICKLQCTYFDV